jgi:hypothetical protein
MGQIRLNKRVRGVGIFMERGKDVLFKEVTLEGLDERGAL